MTVAEIHELVAAVDPMARHYFTNKAGDSFTVWQEYRLLEFSADDEHLEGWAFEIDYYTKQEFDPTAQALRDALERHPGVSYTYQVVYEPDTGYIRHIFDCEGY